MDKKIAKDIRRFALIGNIALNVFVTIVMGVGLGLLIDYFCDTKYWVIICSIAFTFIAIFNFIRMILRISKLDDKKKEPTDDKKNQ